MEPPSSQLIQTLTRLGLASASDFRRCRPIVRRLTRGIRGAFLLAPVMAVTLVLPIGAIVSSKSVPEPTEASQVTNLPIKHVVLIIIDTLRADFLSCLNPAAKPTHTTNLIIAITTALPLVILAPP